MSDETVSKPTWRKGDVLAVTTELSPHGSSVSNGCSVFIAKHNPSFSAGIWKYGMRPERELRLATVCDIERLVAINQQDACRSCAEISRLLEVKKVIKS